MYDFFVVSPSEDDGVGAENYTLELEWIDDAGDVIHNLQTQITVTTTPDLKCQIPKVQKTQAHKGVTTYGYSVAKIYTTSCETDGCSFTTDQKDAVSALLATEKIEIEI